MSMDLCSDRSLPAKGMRSMADLKAFYLCQQLQRRRLRQDRVDALPWEKEKRS